jgi:peptidoglycan/xylan/chitin deacetylase (PgdA/CDA1 family)
MSSNPTPSAARLPGDGGTALVEAEGGHYLFERYVDHGEKSGLLRAYYTLRPFIPRRVQIALRRRYAKRQARAEFPRWPIEEVLVKKLHDELRRQAAEAPDERAPLVNFWPDGHRFAFVLTHDVEGTAGVENIERVRAIERRHGLVSSWNFCAEEYPIPDGLFDRLRAEGCEIGLHAIDHKCRLFQSRENFEEQLPEIHRYLREWDIVGFRSPALHRNADWMPELGAGYDSSYPDTDPFEPQGGGCCWPFPFFNGDMVELPVTLVQDHTHWEILQRPTIELWERKIAWLREVHGLVNVIVHPDYLLTDDRLKLYDELCAHLASLGDGWHALPRDVASWWRRRSRLWLERDDAGVRVRGPEPAGATVAWAWARETDGRIVVEG